MARVPGLGVTLFHLVYVETSSPLQKLGNELVDRCNCLDSSVWKGEEETPEDGHEYLRMHGGNGDVLCGMRIEGDGSDYLEGKGL
jgi:hypothetical protein